MPTPTPSATDEHARIRHFLSSAAELPSVDALTLELRALLRVLFETRGEPLLFDDAPREKRHATSGWHELRDATTTLCRFYRPQPLNDGERRHLELLQSVLPTLAETILLRRLRTRLKTATELIRHITQQLAVEDATLQARLDRLAAIARTVPGVGGALIIALDEHHDPIADGHDNLQPIQPKYQTRLEALNQLADRLREEMSSEVPAGWLSLPERWSASFHPILQADQLTGYLLIAHNDLGRDDSYALLDDLARFYHLPIREALQREAIGRLRALRELAKDLAPNELAINEIVRRIREIFRADTVTLWLEAEGLLHLSSSTDPTLMDLRSGRKVYRPGQGLTGNVWSQNRTVSVFNTHDRKHIAEALQLEAYEGPTHKEVDEQGKEYTQYLGVPIRCGGKAIGVLRLVRSAGAFHFSKDEQAALEFFGELLGLRVDDALRRQILDTVWASENVALIASYEKNVTLVNPGATRLFKALKGPLLGKAARDLYVPGDFYRVEDALQEAVREKERRVKQPMVVYFQSAAGLRSPAELSLHLLRNALIHPPLNYTLGVASDLSEQYASAAGFAQLMHLLDKIRIVFIRCLADGSLVFSNQAEELVTGYSREELMFHREKLWSEPHKRNLLFAEASAAKGQIVRRLIHLRHKKGTPLPVWIQVRLTREGDREILEGLYEDISGRLKLQDWLDLPRDRWVDDKQLLDRLEQDAKDRLHYQTTLKHQLKSPLFALVEHLRLLERSGAIPDEAKRTFGRLISETLVAWRQVGTFFDLDDLLLREHLSVGELRQVFLVQLILQVVDDFNPVARLKHLKVIVEREALRPHEELIAHPRLLSQVISNLLDNAIKYSHKGSTIFFRAPRTPIGPGFEVSSRGAHVEPDERTQLFGRGFRGRRAQGLAEGSGLGLWFSRRVLDLHGGSITYEADIDPNGGPRNTFVVRLHRQPNP